MTQTAMDLVAAYEAGKAKASSPLQELSDFFSAYGDQGGAVAFAEQEYGTNTFARIFVCGFNEVFKARQLSLVRHADRTYTVEAPYAES